MTDWRVPLAPRAHVAPPSGAAPAHEVADGLLLRDDRVLLELRPEDARVAPGAWDSPGGHVEPGEVYRQHVFVVRDWSGEVRAAEGQALAWWMLSDAGVLPSLQPVTAGMLARLAASS